MMRLATILFLLFYSALASAQNLDSLFLANPLDSLLPGSQLNGQVEFYSMDSTTHEVNIKLDSIQTATSQKLSAVNRQYDSVRNQFDDRLGRLSNLRDSLGASNQVAALNRKIDSLQQERLNKLQAIETQAAEIKENALKKINELGLPPELNEKITSLTASIDKLDVTLPTAEFNQVLNFPDFQLSTLPGMNPPGVTVPGVNGIPEMSLPGVDFDNPIGDKMNDLTGEVEGLKDIVPTNLDDAGELAESKLMDMSELDELKKNMHVAGQLPDEAATKEQLVEQAQKAAVNLFAGKEEQLKAAMERLSKYKQKYSSVQSIKNLPLKPPNPMREKKFIERIIPGVTLQLFKRDEFVMDVAPSIGYRFTRRLNAGVGWNSRIVFHSVESDTHVYGPRVYGEFKLFKGISARLDFETMNTFVPENLRLGSDVGKREWVPAVLGGIKKEYRIYKNLRGTALVLYNFYNPNYKSPYGDRLNMRVGFEYVIKRKKQKN